MPSMPYLQMLLDSLFTDYSCPGVVFFLILCDSRYRLVPQGPSGQHTPLLEHLLCCCADGGFRYRKQEGRSASLIGRGAEQLPGLTTLLRPLRPQHQR